MPMKEISKLVFADDVRYSKDHEWARLEGDTVVIGISDFAQDQLGDIVFVELPQVGDSFDKEQEFGTVESVKAVSELYAPVGGEIIGINADLEESPEKVNQDPYKSGWMIKLKPSDASQMDSLMDKNAYVDMLKG
jgi:glycine cleavage system H protein